MDEFLEQDESNAVQHFAVFDENGLPIAFYNTDMNDAIPDGVIEIMFHQWEEFINNPGLRKWHDGAVIEHVPPGPTNEQKWATHRKKANALLQETHWAVMVDSPLSQEKKDDWISYRQGLFAIMIGDGNPDEVTWPEAP